MSEHVLARKNAIVTGGGSGIGFATARVLARDGARVTIVGRTESKLKGAADRLAGEGVTVAYMAGDASSPDDVQAAVSAAAHDTGLDIAVAVPGGGGNAAGVLQYDDDEFSKVIDLNLRPFFLLLKYAGRVMVRSGGGSIVAVSTMAAIMATGYVAPYAAGKAAVDHLVRVAANELGRGNVRVNGVRPGFTRTESTERYFENERAVTSMLDGQPLRRFGEAEDIANAIRYFAGPESSWVTGQSLTVDGGYSLRSVPDMQSQSGLEDQIAQFAGKPTSA